jgi:GMP synthase (glutamine-hydrolysing)
MDLIRAFDGRGRPVLGICLGAQIIARDLRRLRSIAWSAGILLPHHGIDAGSRGPGLLRRCADVTSFQNHFEAVRDFRSAVPLATGGACPIQAFRIGRATYATQFHPEVTSTSCGLDPQVRHALHRRMSRAC